MLRLNFRELEIKTCATLSLAYFLLPQISQASCAPNTPFFCNPLDNATDTPLGVFLLVARLLVQIIGVFAFLFLVIAGIRYIISEGDPQKVTTAKETAVNAIVGLVLALLALQILQALIQALGLRN